MSKNIYISQHVDIHLKTQLNIHEHTKILVNTIERQVSCGGAYGEVVDHQCNLVYASKEGK